MCTMSQGARNDIIDCYVLLHLTDIIYVSPISVWTRCLFAPRHKLMHLTSNKHISQCITLIFMVIEGSVG